MLLLLIMMMIMMMATVCIQKDPSKADDFPGESGAGDAGAIEVVTDAGATEGADDEQDDEDGKPKKKTS